MEHIAHRPPPIKATGPVQWIQAHLLSSRLNIAISLLMLVFLGYCLPKALDWLIFSAVFSGSRDLCTPDGACWLPVIEYFDYYVYGPYPDAAYWRINLGFFLGASTFGLLFSEKIPQKLLMGYIALLPVLLWELFKGGLFLPEMSPSRFGGFMLTFFLGAISMCLSLPVAIVLALGRQAKLPIIRWLCTAYIEIVRSVPLLTFLFMASLMAQLFFPQGFEVDKLFRVLVVMIFVSSAYKAEIIRGGLQAIPPSQVEAAYALGAGYWTAMLHVLLPQALRNSVPALITNFIGVFKETTLVMIVGLLELIGVVKAISEVPEWLGYEIEGYLFVSMIFFIFCFTIAQYGKTLEKRIARARR